MIEKEVSSPYCDVDIPNVPIGKYVVTVTELPREYKSNEEGYLIKVEPKQETHLHLTFK